jgi:hypothetical protein
MIYGLSPRVFIEDGAAARAIEVQGSRSTARTWRALDAERRFAAVQSALKPANDLIDDFPIAL